MHTHCSVTFGKRDDNAWEGHTLESQIDSDYLQLKQQRMSPPHTHVLQPSKHQVGIMLEYGWESCRRRILSG